MGVYTPELLPILSGLAKGFCRLRRLVHLGPDRDPPEPGFCTGRDLARASQRPYQGLHLPSIFGRLSGKNLDWAIFVYNRDPLTRLDCPDSRNADESHFGHFRDFRERARADELPAYSFLEPSWDAGGNSQHPNYNVAAGEQLIHDIYYTLHILHAAQQPRFASYD